MVVGVPKEHFSGERRVALVPTVLASLLKAKIEVRIERGAGLAAGYSDDAYVAVGATLATREEVFQADVISAVRILGANLAGYAADLAHAKAGQTWIGLTESLAEPEPVQLAAEKGIRAFSLELIPRITRAQSMDVLSSQANLAGYKSVLLGAEALPKVLPMMTTAAGTISPARVLIVGVGVAGLQAIATARRLGAVVSAYDVRPETKQQVESLGARFVELETGEEASGTGGYAKAMSEEFYAKQRELLARVCAESDLVITTAAVPGKKSPILITQPMVEGMRPGSAIVDLAAEKGGNCALTKAGETVDHGGVSIIGPVNLPSTLAFHASSLYAKNLATFLLNLTKDGQLNVNTEDPIIGETLLTQDGAIVNARILELLQGGPK
ncbi:MAG: Re/Si-specific NAD(P)(+) transhydrogenase subunit alpha [Fimbriimonas sp.]